MKDKLTMEERLHLWVMSCLVIYMAYFIRAFLLPLLDIVALEDIRLAVKQEAE